MSARPRRLDLAQSGHIATVTVVVLAYAALIVAYFVERDTPGGADHTGAALLVAVVLGVVYLALSLNGYDLLGRLAGRHARTAYFVIQSALVLAILFLVNGSNGIWLIAMPLVATAATDLSPLGQSIIYAVALLSLVGPIYRANGDPLNALFAAFSFSPAIVFVVVFARIAQAAELAQREAEALAAQLADANERLSAYAVQAGELATTQERNRLAREIHDNLGHYLTVANVQIVAAQAVMDKDPARARLALDRAATLTRDGLAAVRDAVSALRDSPLGAAPLHEAIAALAAETQAAGIVADLVVRGAPRPLDPRAELTLYRTAQEGLTNVRKHARASRVDLLLDFSDPAAVALTVGDNGVGRPAGDDHGFGLLGLGERARQLGGTLTVASAPGEGYRLTLRLPGTTADSRTTDDERRPPDRAATDGVMPVAQRESPPPESAAFDAGRPDDASEEH